MIFLIVFLLNLELFVIGQQKSSNEAYQAKKRKEWLRKVPLPKDAIELELKFSFPSEELVAKDIYLGSAWNISNDSSGNIFVSDTKTKRVIKFDPSGNYLFQIGRKGQGPGEFSYGPFKIMLMKNFIVMNEYGRIQFFDKNGKYVKSFKIYKTYRDMVMSDDGLIFAAPSLSGNQSNLIDVLSQEGELLYSFGKPKEFKSMRAPLNTVKLALNNKKELFVAFEHFPIIRKYSTHGELLNEFRIVHKAIKTQEEINESRISSLSKERTGYVIIISAIKAIGNRIYVLHTVPRVKIFEFDNNGQQQSTYWYTRPYGYLVVDFIVSNKGFKKIFYILQKSPDNKIEVFAPKTK